MPGASFGRYKFKSKSLLHKTVDVVPGCIVLNSQKVSVSVWLNQVWFTYTVTSSLAKGTKHWYIVTTGADLDNAVVSEISQSCKITYGLPLFL